jgi:hypothetical protein
MQQHLHGVTTQCGLQLTELFNLSPVIMFRNCFKVQQEQIIGSIPIVLVTLNGITSLTRWEADEVIAGGRHWSATATSLVTNDLPTAIASIALALSLSVLRATELTSAFTP